MTRRCARTASRIATVASAHSIRMSRFVSASRVGLTYLSPMRFQTSVSSKSDSQELAHRADPAQLRHVQDAVAQAQIGAHGSEDPALLGGEDIGRGPADIDGEDPGLQALGRQLEDPGEAGRGGQHRRAHPFPQPVVARGLRHDVVHEELLDGVPGGLVVLHVAAGPDVRHRVVQRSDRGAPRERAPPRGGCRRRSEAFSPAD